jgi:hypothetical protein
VPPTVPLSSLDETDKQTRQTTTFAFFGYFSFLSVSTILRLSLGYDLLYQSGVVLENEEPCLSLTTGAIPSRCQTPGRCWLVRAASMKGTRPFPPRVLPASSVLASATDANTAPFPRHIASAPPLSIFGTTDRSNTSSPMSLVSLVSLVSLSPILPYLPDVARSLSRHFLFPTFCNRYPGLCLCRRL